MQLLGLSCAFGALAFAGLVHAGAYLECGSVACAGAGNNPFNIAVTGVDDLSVAGQLYDVSFASAQPASSPFVFSSHAAAPGRSLTGIDAGNALSAFYGAIPPPYDGYPIAGDPGPAFITAFAPSGALRAAYFGATELWDVAQTSVGGGALHAQVFGNNGFSATDQPIVDNNGDEVYYTKWTAIAAPEMDPNVVGSGFALLAGGIAILRGRRTAGVGRVASVSSSRN